MDKNKSVGQWPNPHLQDRLHKARLIVEAFIQRFCSSRGILSWICVCAGLKEVFPADRWVIRGLQIWSRFWEVTVIGGQSRFVSFGWHWLNSSIRSMIHGLCTCKYVPFIWTCTRLCWMSCRPDRWPTLWCWKNGHDSWYEGFIGRTKKRSNHAAENH